MVFDLGRENDLELVEQTREFDDVLSIFRKPVGLST
jgi:hypothetical protein